MALETNDERGRYRRSAYLDGRRVGHTAWVLARNAVVLAHIRIEPDVRDAGLGSLLACRAFDEARTEGRSALPGRPYMRRQAQLHPGYRSAARPPRPRELSSIRGTAAAAEALEELTARDRTSCFRTR